jgi:transposase-like protein
MLGFKSFDSALITLNGIEMIRMIRKGQNPISSFILLYGVER